MASRDQQKKLIQKLKSNLCGVFVCKEANYDYIAADTEREQPRSNQQDSLERMLTPKVQTRSRTRLAIYYKTPTSKQQQDTFNMHSVMKSSNGTDCDGSQFNQDPVHSTKLDEYIKSPNASQFPYLIQSPANQSSDKATSTMIYKISSNRVIRKAVPNVSQIPIECQLQSISDQSEYTTSTESSFCETCEMSSSTDDDDTILYDIGAVYSCYVPYKAKYEGDLTIKFADRLQIAKDDGSVYVLVKNLSTQVFGYVPRDHIVHVNLFLKNLA